MGVMAAGKPACWRLGGGGDGGWEVGVRVS